MLWSASHDFMACGGTIFPVQRVVTFTSNIPSHPWFCFQLPLLDIPASRVGGHWCRMALFCLVPCWFSQIISLGTLLYFGPLQLELGSWNPLDPCWTTSLKWGVYYSSPGPWTSPDLLWTPFPAPIHSFWSQYIPWRVGIVTWSRYLIAASHFLNRFHQKLRSCSFIPQICRLNMVIACLNWDIFMLSCLDLMSEHPTHVSGHNIFTMTKKCDSVILGVEVICSSKGP